MRPGYSNRYETTYSSSYSRPFQLQKKPEAENYFDVTKAIGMSYKKDPVEREINRKIEESKITSSNEPEFLEIDSSKYNYTHMVNQIAKITDSIYLCGLNAITFDRLNSLGITLVVSAILETPMFRMPSTIHNIQVSVEDSETANIKRHFEGVFDRMFQEEKRRGKILVHCVAGISRSTTLILGYLMRHHKMTLRDAYNLVLTARPYVQPNLGFWRQLIDYEASLFGRHTVQMVPQINGRLLVPNVQPSILGRILTMIPAQKYTPPTSAGGRKW